MKKIIYSALITLCYLVIFDHFAIGQATSVGHSGSVILTDWCGWDHNTSIPLDIRQEYRTSPQPIRFYTDSTFRAIITGAGNVGIGITSPNYLLQQDGGTGNQTYHQFTNGATSGTGSTHGLLIGINSSNEANIDMLDNKPITLSTFDVPRLYIDNKPSGSTPLAGFVAVGNSFTNPASRLHVSQGGSEDAWFQISGNLTGNTATDGFRLGVINSASPYNVEFRQQETGNMLFYTNDGSSVAERARITYQGKVGINTTSPGFQMEVVANAGTNVLGLGSSVTTSNGTGGSISTAGTFITNNANVNYAIRCSTATGANNTPSHCTAGAFYADAGTADNYGVHAEAVNGGANAGNTGGWFSAYHGTSNYGVHGKADSTANVNHGGHFTAANGTQNYGVYASGGSTCTSGSCTDAAGYFSGLIYSTGVLVVSDEFLKDNISTLSGASTILNQLSPKTYTFKSDDYPSMHLPTSYQFGLISEDVEQILPELVHSFSEPEVKDDQGNTVSAQIDFKALNYTELVPILVAGFKEQQAQIDALTAQLDGCCSGNRNAGSSPQGSIDLENINTLQLLDADPNPFSESTMVKWNIPDDFQNAVLYFYDNKGSQINTYKVNSKGAGEVQIFGSKLSAGLYTYTLVVDGKVIDSKKMMRSSH